MCSTHVYYGACPNRDESVMGKAAKIANSWNNGLD